MRILSLLLSIALASCASPKGEASKTTPATTSGGTSVALKAAQLSWSASTGSPSGYQVQQSNDGVTYALVATTTTNSAVVGNLTPGATYYFLVRSFNAGGYSPTSNLLTLHP